MEMSVLGCAMEDPEGRGSALFDRVDVDSFGGRTHHIAAALYRMIKNKQAITPELVMQHLHKQGRLRHDTPSLLADMVAQAFDAHFDHYLQALTDVYLSREVMKLGNRITELAVEQDPGSVMNFISENLVRLRDEADTRPEREPETLLDLLAMQDLEDEWHIPGLLPTSDRLLITANEGGGKSVLLRQIALSYALGLHPFEPTVTQDPGIALLIDAENSRRQVVRGLKNQYAYAMQYQVTGKPENLVVESRQGGMDLCEPGDQAWLLRLVRKTNAKVLCLGPLYRMAGGDINDEATVRCWQRVLEPLLEEGVSIVMEHHAGNGTDGGNKRALRPIGSSVIRRWFSQGVGLRINECEAHEVLYCRVCKRTAGVEMWRGSRDETHWPRHLRSPGTAWWLSDDDPDDWGH